jgi:hypothetical protein
MGERLAIVEWLLDPWAYSLGETFAESCSLKQ